MIFFDQSFIDSLLTQASWQDYFKKEQNTNFLFGSGNGDNPLPFRNFALRNNNEIDGEEFLEKSIIFF